MLFFLLNFFLGSGTIEFFKGQDYSTFAGIGTMIMALVAVISIILTINQDKEAKILAFIKETDQEITTHIEKEDSAGF